jgi:hypothetical protein
MDGGDRLNLKVAHQVAYFQIVGVDPIPGGNRDQGNPNPAAVAQDFLAGGEAAQGEFVAGRDFLTNAEGFKRQTGQVSRYHFARQDILFGNRQGIAPIETDSDVRESDQTFTTKY